MSPSGVSTSTSVPEKTALSVEFLPSDDFRQGPRPSAAIQDYDRANGLYLLERWAVTGESTLATLSVRSPG